MSGRRPTDVGSEISRAEGKRNRERTVGNGTGQTLPVPTRAGSVVFREQHGGGRAVGLGDDPELRAVAVVVDGEEPQPP